MSLLNTIRQQLRLDAKYTPFLSRQLEYIKKNTYDVVYPEHKARLLIPVSHEADPGAQTITYRQWDSFGQAIIISNYADDLPLANALVEEFSQSVESLGMAHEWTIMDIRRAAMAGNNLDLRQAQATRRAHENAVEAIGAAGDSRTGMSGLANNANVGLSTPVTGDWPTATGMQMVGDMMKLVRDYTTANKHTYLPDTLLLDQECFDLASTTPTTTTGDSGKTALQFFLDSNPHVKNVEAWYKLEDMSAGGYARAVLYKRDPEVLTLEIPQEYEQFPPQARNLAFVIPTHMRIGGVIMHYPIAVMYMDGLITS